MVEELLVHKHPKSAVAEAIKSVRTSLQFASIDDPAKVIMITSSLPGEGKSFISANLAYAFAEAGEKVIILDCDLRRGRQNKIFNVSNIDGLSDLLIDDEKNISHYILSPGDPKISLITSGTVPPNPSELLNSKRNKNLIEALKKKYDKVILDCPPVNGLTDSIILSQLADSVIIVASQNKTPIELLKNTKKSLEQVNAKIYGVILNNINTKGISYYSSSYYEQ